MLILKDIVKDYSAGGASVRALKGVSLTFRESEFVSVLGPSGCGKTTMLNIIGGLDHYTSGDLVINGRSTKDYRDADWDAYRNYSIGFVFQNYNLIPHQSVLSNVELALTLSGISKSERFERAKNVLEKVGLSDQIHKRPNQLSGGQMQRVAIARALINDPDILLADEPTGALDSETSVQIMELLKIIAADKLVVMVTHNPDIANEYSTRIIRLLDGVVLSDSNPVDEAETNVAPEPVKAKRPSMSFFTALALSLNNLMTKKARTVMTAVAGSIGIIGIALILALSNGLQSYITNVEKNTLSSYPIMIQKEAMDLSGLLTSFGGGGSGEPRHELDKIYTNNMMARLMNTARSKVETNDLQNFKKYISDNKAELDPLVTAISYGYDISRTLYVYDEEHGAVQVNPSTLFEQLGMAGAMGGEAMGGLSSTMMTNADMWRELIDNPEFLSTQYDFLAGRMPSAYDEAVLVVDERNEIPDLMLYSLGLKGPDDIDALRKSLITGEEMDDATSSYAYDELTGLSFSLVLPTDIYTKTDTGWEDKSGDAIFMKSLLDGAVKVKIVGIAKPGEDAAAVSSETFIGYTHELTEYVISGVNDSEILKAQQAAPDVDVFTGLEFSTEDNVRFKSIDEILAFTESLPDEATRQQIANGLEQMVAAGMSETQIIAMMNDSFSSNTSDATYDGNIKKLQATDPTKPSSINIYASSFENKELIADFIAGYNNGVSDEYKITYTDYVGLLMSSVTTVINAISYVLIAFVSISLVVSSIMIGIITYISVLERTREIGVLRSIGASKRDISRVFNAETLIIGFGAGAFGIIVSALICIPANAIIKHLTDIPNVAVLPPIGAVALVIISMVLTFVAGLIPSSVAAKKDPVVALRSE